METAYKGVSVVTQEQLRIETVGVTGRMKVQLISGWWPIVKKR